MSTANDWMDDINVRDVEPGQQAVNMDDDRDPRDTPDIPSERDWLDPQSVPEEEYDRADPTFVKQKRAPRGSKKYTEEAETLLNLALRFTAPNPATVADAAAILMYGPQSAAAIGELAAHDARVARMMDFLDGGTSNPYLTAATALAPLLIQVMRNHEPMLEPAPRGFKIPFTKRHVRIPFKFGIRIGFLRNASHPPKVIESSVFDDADVMARMNREGIPIGRTR